jgi:hypothetical protein
MRCTWNGDEGVLDEDFTYSDGTPKKRIWRLKHLGNGRYSGTADDVVGEAFGETRGNAFRWGYTLALPVDGKVYEVQFDDWMYLMDDRVMLNKAGDEQVRRPPGRGHPEFREAPGMNPTPAP